MLSSPFLGSPAPSPGGPTSPDLAARPEMGEEPAPPDVLRVVAWRDEIVDVVGVDPRSTYVERFWLPVLGPSATLLLRRTADELEAAPDGYLLHLGDVARALGLGASTGHRSALRRAIVRCARFDVARPLGSGTLMVRRRIAPLPRRHLAKLPAALQDDHGVWERRRLTHAVDARARRARLLALELVGLGEDPGRVERHLVRWGVDPGGAAEASAWAQDRHATVARLALGQSAP